MQRLKRLRLRSLLIVALVLSASATCLSQTTSSTTAERSHASPVSPQDSETLKALEISNIRLAAANETIKLLNDRLAEKDAVIQAKDGTISVKDEMISLLKSANQDRATVNNGDARMLEMCNQQVVKAEARIFKLEHPGLLRSLFDPRALTGFGAGYGARSIQEAFRK